MNDDQGRNIDYIRISITDRCNLRCVYCMPKEGVKMASHKDVLSFDEIERLCKIFAKLGIKKVKITGGEPLVRKGVVELVSGIKKIEGIEKVTLTTNGVLLSDKMEGLAIAGIDGINISLDTMNPKLYSEITRKDAFADVQKGIQKALQYPNVSLKINCVPMGLEGQNLVEIAKMAKDHNIHVRFIEMMPIGYGKNFKFVNEEQIKDLLEEEIGALIPFTKQLGFGPGHYYMIPGFKGKIGFISAISHKFCGNCNRIRLTAQGYLKTCLQYEDGTDLRMLLRSGCKDEEIAATIRKTISEKPAEHHFLAAKTEKEEHQSMSQIGG